MRHYAKARFNPVIERALPDNYFTIQRGDVSYASGFDSHGWTYEDYVYPRLQTCGVYLVEITKEEFNRETSFDPYKVSTYVK